MKNHEHQAKSEALKNPARDTVHEPREQQQPREAVVSPSGPVRHTQQSQLELDRAAGEGMSAPLSDPDLAGWRG